MTSAPARTEYAGSIFRVNFSEEGTPKGVNLVEADTRGNLAVRFCELRSAVQLHNVDCTPENWQAQLEPYRGQGYTKARVHADNPTLNLQGDIRAACPWVVKVEFIRQQVQTTDRPSIDALASTSLETVQSMYRAFNTDADDETVKTINELYQEVTGADTDA